MKHSKQFYLRKAHRYLGVFLGIQFFLWTVGGLYFSWSDMKEVRSENKVNHTFRLDASKAQISPAEAIKAAGIEDEHLLHSRLIDINGELYYQLVVGHLQANGHMHEQPYLVHATSARLLPGLSAEEALALTLSRLTIKPEHVQTTLLEQVSKHHEFRGKPLPAWEIQFTNPDITAYVPVEWGVMMTVRNDKWRIFDFLWMLHTMDYEGRDHFGNYLLKGFSILGIITLLSGFSLFFSSSPFWRNLFKKRK
jgi:uncharacterized iron-regulated membrane protein